VGLNGEQRNVGPGLYLDEQNRLHLDVPELLQHFNVADTPENRDTVSEAAVEVFRQIYPNVPAHVVWWPR
jgi:hypothetical protein